MDSTLFLRRLRTVGISSFLKYYFVFKFYSTEKCIRAFDEENAEISQNSRITKTNAAKLIFKDEMHLEALRYIRDTAKRVSLRQKGKAAWYLGIEE